MECSSTDRLVEHRQSNDSANLSQHGQNDHDEEKSEMQQMTTLLTVHGGQPSVNILPFSTIGAFGKFFNDFGEKIEIL